LKKHWTKNVYENDIKMFVQLKKKSIKNVQDNSIVNGFIIVSKKCALLKKNPLSISFSLTTVASQLARKSGAHWQLHS